ncbi:class I SAM-dependent methyltransferase, partial [Clostridium perfringens]
YKSISLFSVAQAFKDNEGKAYGIDSSLLDEVREYDLDKILSKRSNKFFEGIDSEAEYFQAIEIDMLHIDGNYDFQSVQAYFNNYSPLIREGGIIIFNRIDLDSVKFCYDQYKNDYIILLETNNFGILMKNQKNLNSEVDIPKKLKNLYFRLLEIENRTEQKKVTVNVGVLAYNHEKYIVDCLNSIIKQKGDFNLNIIICEDKSHDGTAGIVEDYIN